MVVQMNGNSVADSVDSSPKRLTSFSRLIVDHYTHTWKVPKFNEIPFIANHTIESHIFNLGKGRKQSPFQIIMSKHSCWPKSKSTKSNKKLAKETENGESLVTEGNKADENLVTESKTSDVCEAENSNKKLEKNVKNEEPSVCEGKKGSEESVKTSEGKEAATDSKIKGDIERRKPMKRFGIRLSKTEDNKIWDVIKYKFTFKTLDGYSKDTEVRVEPGISDYNEFILLTAADFGDERFFNATELEIICDITYSYMESFPSDNPKTCEKRKFSNELKLLYRSKKFSDVKINARGYECLAHKNVLCARAPGFAELLEDDKESEKEKWIFNLNPKVWKVMLDFIYGGRIPCDFPIELCVDLYKAAKDYGVISLKSYCSDFLWENLDSEVCKDCLEINEHTEDYMEVLSQLKPDLLKRILSKEPCSHKSLKLQTS